MKKLLAAFVILDLIFLGLILKIAPDANRNIATIDSESAPESLSQGQKNKWNLVKSIQFDSTDRRISLKSDLLQSLCDVSSVINLVYVAESVAYAGQHPTIHHAFSCVEIKKDLSKNTLITPFEYIVKTHFNPKFEAPNGELIQAFKVFDDEPLPQQWQLSEIKISGQSNFSINSAEIREVIGHDVVFIISSK